MTLKDVKERYDNGYPPLMWDVKLMLDVIEAARDTLNPPEEFPGEWPRGALSSVLNAKIKLEKAFEALEKE